MKALTVLLFIIFILLALIAGPAIIIWALNTLFGLSIVLTFWTWLAVIILWGSLHTTVSYRN